MADVSGRDRGQLFLVGALIIATLLVVLALFLNSGIYAQNLSARNADPGVTGAVEYRGATEDVTEELIVRLNEEDPANASHAELHGNLTTGLTEWSNGTAIHGAYRGKGRSIAVHETHNGTLIRQNATRAFTNRTGNTSDWMLAENTGRVRGFQLNVTKGGTANISGRSLSQLQNDSFYVRIDGDSVAYDVFVGMNTTGATEAINVTVDGPSSFASCDEQPLGPDDRATVDLTNASVDGAHCSELAKLSDANAPYTVTYGNPTQANGTYELVVRTDADDGDAGAIQSSNFNDDPGNGSPWTADAIYSATVDIFFRARSVAYETRVEVVPEEELS